MPGTTGGRRRKCTFHNEHTDGDFYADAKNADILIYNSTIEGEISTLEELKQKNALFADFQAVQDGNVYCYHK